MLIIKWIKYRKYINELNIRAYVVICGGVSVCGNGNGHIAIDFVYNVNLNESVYRLNDFFIDMCDV